jgi:DNA polymerase V
VNLSGPTSSTREITKAAVALFERIADRALTVRRLGIAANRVLREDEAPKEEYRQFDLFSDPEEQLKRAQADAAQRERERSRQDAVIKIRNKFGKNAILKGMNFEEGATARERNAQVGGHRSGEGDKVEKPGEKKCEEGEKAG